jgi:S-adenosylmethionine decarboxylase
MKKLYIPRLYHLYAELYGVKENFLNDRQLIKKLLTDAITKADLHLVNFADHHHKIFNGKLTKHQGVSAVAILEESHAAIYSWPEHNYCIVDILTCGKKESPKTIINHIKNYFTPERSKETFRIKGIK